MPPESVPRVYWDACVFQSYIEAIPDRLPILDALLMSAAERRRRIELVTSTVSITEVAYVTIERQRGRPDPAIEQALDELWAQRDLIWRIEYHELIAREARRLIREGLKSGRSIRSHDAIHLASALSLDVVEFHTYDAKLLNLSGQGLVPFPIVEPHVWQPALPC